VIGWRWGHNGGVRRYLLYVDTPGDRPVWPPVIGVTGLDLDDCLELVVQLFGPRPRTVVKRIVEQPDLTDFAPGDFPLGWGLGVTVWRGVWYPPENLAGPVSLEITRLRRERWPDTGGFPEALAALARAAR
jgi:hypothetical protein